MKMTQEQRRYIKGRLDTIFNKKLSEIKKKYPPKYNSYADYVLAKISKVGAYEVLKKLLTICNGGKYLYDNQLEEASGVSLEKYKEECLNDKRDEEISKLEAALQSAQDAIYLGSEDTITKAIQEFEKFKI